MSLTSEQQTLLKTLPLISQLQDQHELLWLNPALKDFKEAQNTLILNTTDIQDAADRLQRFAAYIADVFPETAENHGLLESPLQALPRVQRALSSISATPLPGKLWMKCDSHLPVSGSIKARGGIYEVLKHAETLAIAAEHLNKDSDYRLLSTPKLRDFFAQHSIIVGSTGNLGLSIGIMSAKLGFQVSVHMSADARQWKKDLLRSKGVTVVEHADDYSKAVEEGREQAIQTPRAHFIDDENSQDLFLGYSVAALRLQKQLTEQQVTVDEDHPLFVYLPCGVGGGPGGVAFGLKEVFGNNVHCFFAEPTQSPCMLLGMYTGLHDEISVQDIGIANKTCADGLAVGRPSAFVGRFIEPLLSGIYTINDDNMYRLLKLLKDTEQLSLEPSALASLPGIVNLLVNGRDYLKQHNLDSKMENATHISWATGGSMVPKEEQDRYYHTAESLSNPFII
jgi:D-serine dehydratase